MTLTKKQKADFVGETCNEEFTESFGGDPSYAVCKAKEFGDKEFISITQKLQEAINSYCKYAIDNDFDDYVW